MAPIDFGRVAYLGPLLGNRKWKLVAVCSVWLCSAVYLNLTLLTQWPYPNPNHTNPTPNSNHNRAGGGMPEGELSRVGTVCFHWCRSVCVKGIAPFPTTVRVQWWIKKEWSWWTNFSDWIQWFAFPLLLWHWLEIIIRKSIWPGKECVPLILTCLLTGTNGGAKLRGTGYHWCIWKTYSKTMMMAGEIRGGKLETKTE